MSLWNYLMNLVTTDIAIDLGTVNTLVYVKGEGIVLNEPSVVSIRASDRKVIAVGNKAKEMLGKTPKEVKAIKPMKDGVIADFEVTEQMLRDFILRSRKRKFLAKPRVIVCVPSGITEVEKRAVRDSAKHAGAREVYLVSEPIAAAIGTDLPVNEPCGNMIIDIGGGTTEVAIISLSHIVEHNSIRVGGDEMDSAIINYLRKKYNLYIGEQTAEHIKIQIGSAYPLEKELSMKVKGRNLVTGFPVTVEVKSEEIRDALSETIMTIIDAVKWLLESTAPELAADIADNGIVLTGGACQTRGLDQKLRDTTDLPVNIVNNPLTSVVLGSGKILDNLNYYAPVLMKS